MKRPDYFLVSLSGKVYLDLCIKHGLAGFPGSSNGIWTFYDIREGDYISFLYGAKVYNLYEVIEKRALADAEKVPPWPPLVFTSGLSYWFPFRLRLRPLREILEPLVRAEFAYVAENLLLRGGYRRTHFQADQTTLQYVSQMGHPAAALPTLLEGRFRTYTPNFLRGVEPNGPSEFPFSEKMLQAAVRHVFSRDEGLSTLSILLGGTCSAWRELEALGEKALPQGHVDILLKEARPIGGSRQVPVEVKLGKGEERHVQQVRAYMDELGSECDGGLLIASGFARKALQAASTLGVTPVLYSAGVDLTTPRSFDEITIAIKLQRTDGTTQGTSAVP